MARSIYAAVDGSDYHGQILSLLGELPWTIRSFSSAAECLRSCRQGGHPAAVVVWADGSGLELVDALQGRGDGLAPPALVAITDDEPSRIEMARQRLGRLGHLTWPVAASELCERVRDRIERCELQGRLADAEAQLAERSESLGRALATATERLVTSEQLAAVGRVAGGIARELESQLAMVGYAEAIKARVSGDPELTEFADIIVNAQKRLAAMVDEIRDFATAHGSERAGRLRPQPAELGSILDDSLALMRYDPVVRKRLIVREYRHRPLAAIDRQRFAQVILNLVSNAALATSEGERITIVVDEQDDRAVVEVVDAGEGMGEDVLARLGEIFFTTRDIGTGLGVGICRRIVEEHGGTLGFRSRIGAGTTARIELPLLGGNGHGGPR